VNNLVIRVDMKNVSFNCTGREARQSSARMVKPFAGGNQSDAADARAIWTAVQQQRFALARHIVVDTLDDGYPYRLVLCCRIRPFRPR
jgi:hypothetical protein